MSDFITTTDRQRRSKRYGFCPADLPEFGELLEKYVWWSAVSWNYKQATPHTAPATSSTIHGIKTVSPKTSNS